MSEEGGVRKPRGSDVSRLSNGGDGGIPDITSPHELMVFVEDVLGRLESNFDTMSNQVLQRLETISKRIDMVEQNISDLMQGNASEGSGATAMSASTFAGGAVGGSAATGESHE